MRRKKLKEPLCDGMWSIFERECTPFVMLGFEFCKVDLNITMYRFEVTSAIVYARVGMCKDFGVFIGELNIPS